MLLITAYACAAVTGAIAAPVATYSLFVLLCANLITGLLNRAALEEHARSLWQHAQVTGLPVSLLLIDIDERQAADLLKTAS